MNRSAQLASTTFFAAIALSLGLLAGCTTTGSATGPGGGPSDGLSCGRRLVGGSWRFVGFLPDRPLDPQSRQNLEHLQGSLRVSFNGQQALTTGPGLQHVGPYQVDQDDGVSCRISAPDDAGVASSTRVRFLDGNHLEVTDSRSPVPGRATLERMGNAM